MTTPKYLLDVNGFPVEVPPDAWVIALVVRPSARRIFQAHSQINTLAGFLLARIGRRHRFQALTARCWSYEHGDAWTVEPPPPPLEAPADA